MPTSEACVRCSPLRRQCYSPTRCLWNTRKAVRLSRGLLVYTSKPQVLNCQFVLCRTVGPWQELQHRQKSSAACSAVSISKTATEARQPPKQVIAVDAAAYVCRLPGRRPPCQCTAQYDCYADRCAHAGHMLSRTQTALKLPPICGLQP